MKQCAHLKADKTQCKGFAVKDDIYCFFHSEKHKKEREEAVLKGGNSLKRSYVESEPVSVRSNLDAVYLLEKIINEVRANKISSKTGSVLGFLINLSLKSIPLALGDKRIERNVILFNKGKIDLKAYIEKL
jgi:hypothetical protein